MKNNFSSHEKLFPINKSACIRSSQDILKKWGHIKFATPISLAFLKHNV